MPFLRFQNMGVLVVSKEGWQRSFYKTAYSAGGQHSGVIPQTLLSQLST